MANIWLTSLQALLSIFRSRTGDANKGGNSDSSIERCDVSIEDGPSRKSRFVAKIAWRNGKVHRSYTST